MTLIFSSDTIANIKHMYARTRHTLDKGCSTTYLLLDIESCTKVPDFSVELVPKPGHQFYLSILGSYKSISNALLTFFLRPETVVDSTSKTFEAIKSVETSSDGFVFLATILHQLLPQFGRERPNLLVEMGKLVPILGEDYKSFRNRAVDLDTRLTLP